MRLAKCGHPAPSQHGPIPARCDSCRDDYLQIGCTQCGTPFVPHSRSRRCPACRDERFKRATDPGPLAVDTATLLRLSIRFPDLRKNASTANLSGLWSGICASLGRGNPDDFQLAALDMAAELVVLADQRAR